MDSLSAYAMGQATKGKERMIFDWEKAARLIVEAGARTASAGLSGDWEWTGGSILIDGKPADDYTYLASTWATPELAIDDGPVIDCYRMKSDVPGWNEHTQWPPEAMAILNQEETQTQKVNTRKGKHNDD